MSHNLGPVKQWSFSRLANYEECPYRLYLSAVERRPGPARGEDHPAERGTRIHTACERYVKDEGPLVKEMRRFETDFEALKEHYNDGHVQLEGDWGFDIDWQQTGWWDDNVWARIKLDAFRRYDDQTAGLIDYKTGKKMGNEVKHTQQAQLYAVGAFMRYPEIDLIHASFWYLDQGQRFNKTYKRDNLALYLKKFNQRALALTTAANFPAKPNKMKCRWCEYGINKGTGECPYAVPND